MADSPPPPPAAVTSGSPLPVLTRKPRANPFRTVSRAPDQQSPSLATIGLKRRRLADLYHWLLTIPWRLLLALEVAVYLCLNLLFALLYWAGGDCIAAARPGQFSDLFFFSVQTFATIGYGAMAPQTTYAHAIVTLESLVGILSVALATGLMFAKFSRPTSRVLFSDVAVVVPRNGVPHLMFRMANQRGNQLVEARLQASLARWEVTAEGERMRRFYDLGLVRQQNLLFVLTWTAMHPMDAASPLYGLTPDELFDEEAEIIVALSGTDGTMNQTVHARWSYLVEDIRWGQRFVDVIEVLPDGTRRLDYRCFHLTEPAPERVQVPGRHPPDRYQAHV